MAEKVDKITKAKAKLVFDNRPFFASLAARLDIIEVPTGEKSLGGQAIDTMATDMERIFYNPDFVEKITIEECAGVLMHEILHVAYLHGLRRGSRDPLLWNIACDYAINPIVLDSGGKLPRLGDDPSHPGYCLDAKYKDWSATAIYDDLLKDAKEMPFKLNGQGGDGEDGKDGKDGKGKQPLWGEILDPQDETGKKKGQAQQADLENETKLAVQSAAAAAKAVGKLPGSLQGLVEAIGEPEVDWQDYIAKVLASIIPDNYTWRKPRRSLYANYGIYMPSTECNGCGRGVVSIDTSGSVSDAELRAYVREVAGVIDMCNPDHVDIIQHDAVVHSITEWEAGDDFSSLKITGRGGTCIQPTFDAIEEMDEQPAWVIILSDCEIWDWPNDVPEHYQLLICSTSNMKVPSYGDLIPLRKLV